MVNDDFEVLEDFEILKDLLDCVYLNRREGSCDFKYFINNYFKLWMVNLKIEFFK